VQDPHPEAKFFTRSDNYALAKARSDPHTVSSFGLHKEYHRPNDDFAHLDLNHMADAIGSIDLPVKWLVNSSFKPQWNAGQKPNLRLQ